MPIVKISLAAGRDPEVLRACLQAVHIAVRDSLEVPDSAVRVLITEVPPGLWSSGGVTLEERSANREAGDTRSESP
ncbi:4-oxalocrotonate tautomerase family protein [Nonomuraea sp. NPDC049480]|uniref:4-oxalocrotonate tautomerase family protein n=1 Tax=Nonomuraea sp. NPDC049480 TaxID=3364353 RepID=UPI00379A0245